MHFQWPKPSRAKAAGTASFSVSESATLVYAHGAASTSGRLVWFDRTGKTLGTVGDAGAYLTIALSPDERRVAASMQTGLPVNRDVWLIDIARGVESRLTFDSTDEGTPVWSPDGTRVAFWKAGTKAGLHVKSASGIGAEEMLFSAGLSDVHCFSRTGPPTAASSCTRRLRTGPRPWICGFIPLSGDRKPIALAQASGSSGVEPRSLPTAAGSRTHRTRRDRRRFTCNRFLRRAADSSCRETDGAQPLWRGDGKELFFMTVRRNRDVRRQSTRCESFRPVYRSRCSRRPRSA